MLSDLNTVTHSIWVQAQYDADDANWPCGTNGAYIFDYRADASNQVALWFDPTTDDRLQLWINNAARVNVTGQTFKSGDLLHLVVTLDFDNDIYTLYLNGATVGSSTALLSAPTATTFKLGIRNDNNASYMGGWRFGEYAVFGRVLTAEEVASLYARGKPLADAGALRRPGIYIMDGEIDLRTSQTGARVQIDADGIGGYSATTTKTFSLETDGDLFLGSDISAAGTTALAVFANAQTYGTASESMGAGDVLLGDNSAGKINLLWDVSEGDVILRRGTSARITLDGSADSILIGQVAASQNNILISSGAISVRNNDVERIGVTAAGILTIKDSGGNAVITLDASAGAEITKTLAMKGAAAAISIGETPPASATSGTGIWIDRTGFYSLDTDVYQVKIDAIDGKLYAGGGSVMLDSVGITLDEGDDIQNYIKWKDSGGDTLGYITVYDVAIPTQTHMDIKTISQNSTYSPSIRLLTEVGGTDYHSGIFFGTPTSGGVNFSIGADGYAYLQLVKSSGEDPKLRLFWDAFIEIDQRSTHPTATTSYGQIYAYTNGVIYTQDGSGNKSCLGYDAIFGTVDAVNKKFYFDSSIANPYYLWRNGNRLEWCQVGGSCTPICTV